MALASHSKCCNLPALAAIPLTLLLPRRHSAYAVTSPGLAYVRILLGARKNRFPSSDYDTTFALSRIDFLLGSFDFLDYVALWLQSLQGSTFSSFSFLGLAFHCFQAAQREKIGS